MAAQKPARPATLLDLCDGAGLSAAQLAAALGIGVSTVYAWSTGRLRPRYISTARIAAALRTSEQIVEAALGPRRKMGRPRKH